MRLNQKYRDKDLKAVLLRSSLAILIRKYPLSASNVENIVARASWSAHPCTVSGTSLRSYLCSISDDRQWRGLCFVFLEQWQSERPIMYGSVLQRARKAFCPFPFSWIFSPLNFLGMDLNVLVNSQCFQILSDNASLLSNHDDNPKCPYTVWTLKWVVIS